MYYLYIVENNIGRLYIGVSSDPERRLESHNQPSGSDWTQGKGPWHLIYTETYTTKSDALRREKQLKGLKAGKRLKKILQMPL